MGEVGNDGWVKPTLTWSVGVVINSQNGRLKKII